MLLVRGLATRPVLLMGCSPLGAVAAARAGQRVPCLASLARPPFQAHARRPATSAAEALDKSQALLKKGKVEEYAKVISKIADAFPDDLRVLERLGDVKRVLGDTHGAHAALSRAIDLAFASKDKATMWRCMLMRADLFARQANYEQARKDLEATLQLVPRQSLALERLGFAHFHEAQLNPKDKASTASLAQARSRFEEALGSLEDAGDSVPQAFQGDKSNILYGLGLTLVHEGKLDDALQPLSQAVEADPTFAPAYHARASIFLKKGAWGGAIADFTSFLNQMDYYKVAHQIAPGMRLDHLLSEALYKRAVCYFEFGDSEMAVEDLGHVLQLQALFVPEALFRRAKYHFDKGDYWEAVEDCTEALKKDGSNLGAFQLRMMSYQKLKLEDKAKDDEKMCHLLRRQQLFKSV